LKKIDEHRAGAVNFRLASKDVLNVLIKEFQYYHNLRFTFHRNIKHSLPDFLLAQKYCDGPKPKILHVSEDLLSVALNTRTLNTYSGKENLKRRVDQIVSSVTESPLTQLDLTEKRNTVTDTVTVAYHLIDRTPEDENFHSGDTRIEFFIMATGFMMLAYHILKIPSLTFISSGVSGFLVNCLKRFARDVP
jgi:hypothetical protein